MSHTTRTATRVGRDAREPSLLWVLVIAHHPDRRYIGAVRPLAGDGVVALGRGSADLGPGALDDPRISRDHARVVGERGGPPRLFDLGSRNGTFVSGRRVAGQRALADGDTILVGPVLLVARLARDDYTPASDPILCGIGPAAAALLANIAIVAPRATTVLLLGETGVGKEVVARRLHERSGRRGKLVAVNCGALGDGVAASELFGHVRGAFSGAVGDRAGLVREAEHGTLFLDEIGDASPALQTTLLRLLQEHEVRPVGGDRARTTDVRFVAATNRPLAAEVAAGRFRKDLHTRLSRWVIEVPPLRARAEDVPLLAETLAVRYTSVRTRLAPSLAEALALAPWPGNVRQLDAIVERLVLRAETPDRLEEPEGLRDELAEAAGAPPLAGPPSSFPAAASAAGGAAPAPLPRRGARGGRPAPPEPARLRELVAESGGNLTALAESLGVGRPTLYRWLQRHGIDVGALRGAASGRNETGT